MDRSGTGISAGIATIEEMRRRKREKGYSYEEIARRSGLPLGTVQKVLGGFTRHPRNSTLGALDKALFEEKYLQAEREDRYARLLREESKNIEEMLLRDGAPVYITDVPHEKRQGEFTITDRASRPEKYPSELIDGVIYDMTAPTFAHQMIAGEIYSGLRDYIREHKGNCIPFMAAADVRLDRDDRTMVMPDVFVVCDRDKIVGENGKYMDGAPDLVVEVVSPSTRKKDMGIKLEKYRKAGVREYWMVDYVKRKVIVWTFGDDPDVSLYGFEGEIPVGIYGGECRIDFTEIARQLRQIRGWDDVK